MTETWKPSQDTVAFLIDQFGLPYTDGRLTNVARGSMGRVWRFDLVGPTTHPTGVVGDRLMVKQFFWGADEHAEHDARVEADFCRRAAAAGVALTQGIPAADGTYVQRLPTSAGEVVLRLNTWAGGRELKQSDPGRAEYLGRTLGTLHGLHYPAEAQPDPYFTTPPSDEAWVTLLDQVLSRADRAPGLARILPDRLADLMALGSYVDPSPQQDLIVSHRDVKPGNVLRDDATGAFTLIDWDEVGPISPSRELAAQLCVWHVRDGVVRREAIRRTIRAYRAVGGTGTVDSLSCFSLRLANDLNYIHDEVLAALGDELPEDMRQHAESEAELFIGAAPTPSMLGTIIEAATPTGLWDPCAG